MATCANGKLVSSPTGLRLNVYCFRGRAITLWNDGGIAPTSQLLHSLGSAGTIQVVLRQRSKGINFFGTRVAFSEIGTLSEGSLNVRFHMSEAPILMRRPSG